MNILLDTHYLIWVFCDTGNIASSQLSILQNEQNNILYSDISLFEIAIKYRLKKLDLAGGSPEDLFNEIESSFLVRHPLNPSEIISFYRLDVAHKDPFDRMLMWQAMKNSFHLLTADKTISKIKPKGLLLL